MHTCETSIGLMKNLQTSLPVEETWVDGTTEILHAMPTATSAREIDVSKFNNFYFSFLII